MYMYWVVSPSRVANGQWPVPLPRGTLVVTSWCSHLQSSRALLRFSHLAEQSQGAQYQRRARPKTPSQSSFILQDVSPIRRRRATAVALAAIQAAACSLAVVLWACALATPPYKHK
ncbi:uncharacterized protein TrAFT101_007520 [Trichoderma asperellum]|uniref:uncharacterized protein n=1 Tax=Trichoderma asperellum TaxID=101201 RepID=UPI0033318E29|nr:hypothetical protein TrAFT101_007520 [Trichoderma asperellum]